MLILSRSSLKCLLTKYVYSRKNTLPEKDQNTNWLKSKKYDLIK